MKSFDTTLLSILINKDPEYIKNKIINKQGNIPEVIASKINEKEFGPIQEKLFLFEGFYSEKKITRKYNYKYASHILGYIREVNKEEIENDSTKFYKQKDIIGANGIDKYYEKQLRGIKGTDFILVNSNNIVRFWLSVFN